MKKAYHRLRAALGLYPEAWIVRELGRRARTYLGIRSTFLKAHADPNYPSSEHLNNTNALYRAAAAYDELVMENLELVRALAPDMIGLTSSMGTTPALVLVHGAQAAPAPSGVQA